MFWQGHFSVPSKENGEGFLKPEVLILLSVIAATMCLLMLPFASRAVCLEMRVILFDFDLTNAAFRTGQCKLQGLFQGSCHFSKNCYKILRSLPFSSLKKNRPVWFPINSNANRHCRKTNTPGLVY